MSVALSNRFQGRRLLSPRYPAPDVPGSPPVCAVRRARELGGGAWPGWYPSFPADSLSPAGGKAFGLLKARQEKRLEEINRVSRVTVWDSVWVPCAALCHPFPPDKISPFLPYPWPSAIASLAPAVWPPTPGKSIPPLSSLPGVSSCKL